MYSPSNWICAILALYLDLSIFYFPQLLRPLSPALCQPLSCSCSALLHASDTRARPILCSSVQRPRQRSLSSLSSLPSLPSLSPSPQTPRPFSVTLGARCPFLSHLLFDGVRKRLVAADWLTCSVSSHSTSVFGIGVSPLLGAGMHRPHWRSCTS